MLQREPYLEVTDEAEERLGLVVSVLFALIPLEFSRS